MSTTQAATKTIANVIAGERTPPEVVQREVVVVEAD